MMRTEKKKEKTNKDILLSESGEKSTSRWVLVQNTKASIAIASGCSVLVLFLVIYAVVTDKQMDAVSGIISALGSFVALVAGVLLTPASISKAMQKKFEIKGEKKNDEN